MVGCSLINCSHALSNMAPSDLDSQYLGEMLHGSWKWLIKIGTVCYPNILKFSLKIQDLIATPHSSLWYLSTAISSWIPAPAGFNEESLGVRGRRVNAGQDHAVSPAWAHEKFFAEVGLRLPLSEKGSCGQRTLIRRLLKPQGSAPEHSHKPATGSVLYKVSVPGRAVVWVLLLLQGSSEKRGQRRKLRRLHCVLWVDVPTGFCLSQSGVKYTVKTISLLQHSSAHACKPK